jgi:hypothetical protein
MDGYGENAFSWSWKLLVEAMPTNFTFLEIGVYKGRVLSQVGLLSSTSNKNAKIYGITPLSTSGDKYLQNYDDVDYRSVICNNFLKNNSSSENLTILNGYSQDPDILKNARGYGKFDIIFIDGSHNYEDVCSDISNYVPMLKSGGYLVMDDASLYLDGAFGMFLGHPDVGKAILDVLDKMVDMEHIYAVGHNRVWRKKENITTVVSAASSNHFNSACQLLHTVPESFNVIFYDIGLTNSERSRLISTFPRITLRTFDFAKYPEHVLLSSQDAGAYAWKPIIISEVYSELSDGILLWCDAGNMLNSKIHDLPIIIQKNKIYTPHSWDDIQKWTHPSCLKYMNVPDTFLNMACRNAAFVGFLCNDETSTKFINEWKEYALIKDAILPEGANRWNHRHDQSILSCLFYKYGIPEVNHYVGFTIHNDIG